jgi:phosphatidylglycerophosphate synthase
MVARNRIWEELLQAKVNIVCIQRYTDSGRKILRIIDSLIIICATVGTVGSVYNKWFAIICIGLVTISSILKSILPNITQSEQELSELDRLMTFYSMYMNNLERLWYEYNNEKKIFEHEMIHKLFEMKQEECDKYSLLNKEVRNISKKENKKIKEKCTEYINRVYFKPEKNESK